MFSSIESLVHYQIKAGMIVLGSDAALVGEVLSRDPECMLVVRRPLPAIRLPLDLVAAVVNGVAVLSLTADAADALGEIADETLDPASPAAV